MHYFSDIRNENEKNIGQPNLSISQMDGVFSLDVHNILLNVDPQSSYKII